MNELKVFENSEFGKIRTITINNEPWFVASDICKALGLSNPTVSVQRLDDDERAKFNLGVHDSNGTNCINEYGLYNLILASRKKEAKEFKRWITHEVIPSIRKHGMYATDELINNPDLLIAVATELKAEREKNKALQEEKESLEIEMLEMDKAITELAPKADYADRILSSTDCMTVSQIAQDYGMSAKRFNRVLASACIQRKVGEQWILYTDHQGKGYVRSKTHEYTKRDSSTGTKQLTVWTQKGRMFIYERLKTIGILPEMETQSA